MSPIGAGTRRLRIAYVYDALYPFQKGGAERRFHELALRLSPKHEVHYITWAWPGAASACAELMAVHGVGPPKGFYGDDGKRTVSEALSFAIRLIPAIVRGRYDVIDCSATPYLPLYSCGIAARFSRTPMVATWHEFWADHWSSYLSHRPLVAPLARFAEANAIRFGNARIAVSRFTADRLLRAGAPGESLRVVENGVSLNAFAMAPVGSESSDVVYVGRLIEDKKVGVLLAALHRLRADFPHLRCLIIGDGPERARLQTLAADLRLSDQVRFLGELDERSLQSTLKASKVMALPSVREGFGMVVLEAQAAGLVPVVARSEHSAASSLISDGTDGLTCEPNVDSLAGVLRSLLGDPSRLAQMRQAASAAATRWDWDRIAERMEDVYLRLATRRASVIDRSSVACL